jgi:hypothetical protein
VQERELDEHLFEESVVVLRAHGFFDIGNVAGRHLVFFSNSCFSSVSFGGRIRRGEGKRKRKEKSVA